MCSGIEIVFRAKMRHFESRAGLAQVADFREGRGKGENFFFPYPVFSNQGSVSTKFELPHILLWICAIWQIYQVRSNCDFHIAL